MPRLSPQQETQLAEAIADATSDSDKPKKRLVEAHLGLVVSIVQRCGRTELVLTKISAEVFPVPDNPVIQ